MKIWKNSLLFCTGGAAYHTIELLYRGRSHASMFFAGGLCFLLMGHLNRVEPKLPLPLRAVTGALIVTMVELGIGMAVNRGYQVWDYRGQPLNFMGQICLPFSLLWIPVSALGVALYEGADRLISRKETSPGRSGDAG